MSIASDRFQYRGQPRSLSKFIVCCFKNSSSHVYFKPFEQKIFSFNLQLLDEEDKKFLNANEIRHILERIYSKVEYNEYNNDSQRIDTIWFVLDIDDFLCDESEIRSILDTLESANKAKIALSNPCFEFWILCHAQENLEQLNFPNCESIRRSDSYQSAEYCPIQHRDRIISAAMKARLYSAEQDGDGVNMPGVQQSMVYKMIDDLESKNLI